MARQPNSRFKNLLRNWEDEVFLKRLGQIEGIVSKVLSIAMVIVILVTVIDLAIVLYRSLLVTDSVGFFKTTLTEIFGLFLSVLIALEILENITAYIRRHVVQVELVIATALTAVGRKLNNSGRFREGFRGQSHRVSDRHLGLSCQLFHRALCTPLTARI
jgi:uncharacterized membrane protein (DUF373 family)